MTTKQPLTQRFGSRVRHLRKQRGWSIQKLAERSGLNSNFIQKLETGVQSVSLPYVEKLAAGLDITVQELFAFDEPVPEARKRLKVLVDKASEAEVLKLAKILEAILH